MLFQLGQNSKVREVLDRFPTKPSSPDYLCLHIADDGYLLGQLDKVLPIHTAMHEALESIGLQAVANSPKNFVYTQQDLTPHQETVLGEKGLSILRKSNNDGFVAAGVPIGSHAFVQNFLDDTLDGILKQLNWLQEAATSSTLTSGCTKQTCVFIARLCIPSQLTYFLRTIPQEATQHIAERLDRAIYLFIKTVMECDRFVEDDDVPSQNLFHRIFLPARMGGFSFVSSASTARAAFVSSVALVGTLIREICPSIPTALAASSRSTARSFAFENFSNCLNEFKQRKFAAVERISQVSIWTEKATQLQKAIKAELDLLCQQRLKATLPQGDIACGYKSNHNMSLNDMHVRAYGVAQFGGSTGAWVSAPPVGLCKMSDALFTKA